MKKLFLASFLLIVLLVGYWAWPFVGLGTLASALQAHDAAAVSEQVDFEYLRRNLTAQIVASYLRLTGREGRLGPLRALAPGIGASLADPWVSQIVNVETLVELLRGGTIQSELGTISLNSRELPNFSLRNAWNAWFNSEYGLGHFSIGLPANVEAVEQFRLRMQLLGWRWKLTGIDLPAKLRDQVAQELAKKYP
jgi:hypothetical protein